MRRDLRMTAPLCGTCEGEPNNCFLVDVGFTLASGEVNVYGLELGKEIDGYAAHLSEANPCCFHPTERKMRFAADSRRVYMGDAGFDAIDELENFGGVVGI